MSTSPQTDREVERQKRRSCRCVHFNGTQNQKCDAGIAYADVQKVIPDAKAFPRQSLPCWVDNETFNPLKVDCSARRLPTKEELAAEDQRQKKSFENMIAGRRAIMDFIKERGELKQNVAGKIQCPNCKTGELYFRRAGAFNGHIHAKCTTSDCTGWME